MTEIKISIERAVKRLLFIKEHELQPADKLSFAATKMAIQALEKRIPKKVIKTETSSQACPECKSNVRWKYCPNCGQKLDYGYGGD